MADASFDEKIVPSDCKNNGLGRDKSQGYSEGGVFLSFIYYEKNKIFNRYMKNTNLGCENCKKYAKKYFRSEKEEIENRNLTLDKSKNRICSFVK